MKVNLTQLNGAFLKELTGRTATKRCIIIPVDDNLHSESAPRLKRTLERLVGLESDDLLLALVKVSGAV